jgi:hypothetical protein
MNMTSAIANGRCDALVEALRAEFGSLWADRILEAEAADFMWDARVSERYLGQQIGWDQDEEEAPEELSRVAITAVVDGDCFGRGDRSNVALAGAARQRRSR